MDGWMDGWTNGWTRGATWKRESNEMVERALHQKVLERGERQGGLKMWALLEMQVRDITFFFFFEGTSPGFCSL